jgi:hypothetical protein
MSVSVLRCLFDSAAPAVHVFCRAPLSAWRWRAGSELERGWIFEEEVEEEEDVLVAWLPDG